ncbi:sialidase family protein [Chryseolinea lacunae]|uniref:Exo-alpha-sialidase n=1 Tax=Chryseolinea lacunae TaxID=2801331 RepID=A0ABS1KQ01_9BACT|nr:sialidase family protein [Chryseolinea lacunae]MBL0741298.1 exo-alpha-sialidase [Chryseolinea lacunae]
MRKMPWLAALCCVSMGATAQIKNIKVEDAPAGATAFDATIAITADKIPSIVVAIPPDRVLSSQDAQTWTPAKFTSTSVVAGSPRLLADSDGGLYAFHTAKNENNFSHILCHISKDGGKTWEEGASAGGNPPKDQLNPGVSLDSKNNLMLTWTEFDKFKSDDAACQSRIMISTSSNGKKWAKPVALSQTPGDCKDDSGSAEGSMPGMTADGKAFVAWANQNKIFMDRSFNGGDMWLTNDIGVTEQRGGWNIKVPGYAQVRSLPTFMVDKSKGKLRGSLYVVWADQRSGTDDTDVWFMRSLNYGDNWTSPIRIGQESKGHQFMPAFTIDPENGNLYILYFDRHATTDTQTDVYLAYSSNGGQDFQNVKVSETSFVPTEMPGVEMRNSIAAGKGIITPLWTRIDDGKASVWTAVIKETDIIAPPVAAGKTKKKK